MTDLTKGKIFDRVSQTWLEPEEHRRRMDVYEEQAFQRRANQGELSAPMVLRDEMRPVQSMTNGQMYDSKSAIRAEYRRAGVVEVGNDVPKDKPKISWASEKKKRKASIGRALSRAGFGA